MDIFSSVEREVIAKVKQAKSNKEIAYELGISIYMVKYHLGQIFRTLNIHSRVELALLETLPELPEEDELIEEKMVE